MNQTDIDMLCGHPVLNRFSHRGEEKKLYGRCCYCNSFRLIDDSYDVNGDKAYKKELERARD